MDFIIFEYDDGTQTFNWVKDITKLPEKVIGFTYYYNNNFINKQYRIGKPIKYILGDIYTEIEDLNSINFYENIYSIYQKDDKKIIKPLNQNVTLVNDINELTRCYIKELNNARSLCLTEIYNLYKQINIINNTKQNDECELIIERFLKYSKLYFNEDNLSYEEVSNKINAIAIQKTKEVLNNSISDDLTDLDDIIKDTLEKLVYSINAKEQNEDIFDNDNSNVEVKYFLTNFTDNEIKKLKELKEKQLKNKQTLLLSKKI